MTTPTKIFAYGSNMWSHRMIERVSTARFWSLASGKDMALKFNKVGSVDGTGKANIIKRPGSRVFGVIYHIQAEQLATLDNFEKGYHRSEFEFLDIRGKLVVAQAYWSNRTNRYIRPTITYKNFVTGGAMEHRLPLCYVLKLNSTAVHS